VSRQTTSVKDRLVVALDFPNRAGAIRIAERLSGLVGMFKIGIELYTAEGPSLVREIVESGERVFLDLKFHDIPNTVAGAVRSALSLGVSILNVHSLGGAEMMRAAAREAARFPSTAERPAVLAVTVLTSMDKADLAQVGVSCEVEDEVVRLATLARDSALDGVVCSPREIRLIRRQIPSEDFIILTPGIRPAWSSSGDQKRIATPAQAIGDGANYIVIGRAITSGDDPRGAAERVLEEINNAQ
jgi:orotidine-5'-phosphate decarboxylase